MKKTLLTAMLFAAGISANAQLANGTTAPDFTATDINGNTHSLYADYLNQGKTVILDLSATWCGPCWSYHNTHALEDLYNSYGNGASGEVVVLFVEADPGTSLQSLYGYNVASDNSVTQGNWVEGTQYPIINDTGAIKNAYALTYFPTIYRICPDGNTTLIGQQSTANLKSGIQTGCDITLTGVQNSAQAEADDLRLCDVNGSMKVKMKNFGTNKINSATVVLEHDGTVVATKEYTSNSGLNQFSSSTLTFDPADFDPSLNYTARISSVNGSSPYSASIAAAPFNVFTANESNNNIEIWVYTDSYPAEIKWNLKDSSGATVASGGPYAGAAGGASGGADANTVKVTTLSLPAGSMDCYKLTMQDTYGDGWSLGTGDFQGVRIYTNTGLVDEFSGDFGFSTNTINAAFKTTGALSTENPTLNKFAVYPNPTTGVLNFTTTEEVSVVVTDLTGKTVFTAANINNGGSINLAGLQKGMYIAQIKGAATQTTQKIIIE